MTKLEFLEDTVKYYSENTNRRCVNNVIVGCYYSPENADKVGISEGCAIGRYLDDSLKEELDNLGGVSVKAHRVFDKLPEELKELGKYFLREVQILHDSDEYWDSNGLTERGTDYYNFIKERYG